MRAPYESADPSLHGSTKEEAPAESPRLDPIPIVVGIMMAMFLAALDQTIVATALPRIGVDLNDVAHLSWVVTAYLIASTAATPLYGKLSDIHGRRITMLAGLWIFLVGSIACALAPNMLTLVLARAVQGLGGGGLLSLAQTIIADVIPPRERGRYQVLFASVFVVSSLLGPVLGGLFAEYLHWSLIFWINLPLGAIALVMTSNRLKALPRHDRPHKLDWLGSVLMVAATTLTLLALNWGGATYPWSSPQILGLFAVSALAWALFTARLLTAPEPFIPLTLLAHPVVITGTLTSCFAMGTFIGLTIYMPIYLQTVAGLSESASGFALIPLMIGTVLGATGAGQMMARVKHYKRLPMALMLVSIPTMAILAVHPTGLPLWQIELIFFISSVGLGTLLPTSLVSIQNAVPMHQMGTATANMNFFRSLGGAFAVAVFGAILLGTYAGEGSGRISAEQAAALSGQFGWLFVAVTIGMIGGLVSLALMRELPLHGRSIEAAHSAIAD